MSVTANKCSYGEIFNKCNAATDNKIFSRSRFSNHISIHCEKCGNEIGDNEPVYKRGYYIAAGCTVYSYEWRGWYFRNGAAKSYKRNNDNQSLSVCSNCIGTYFENRNKRSGECLFCNRTVTKEWSASTVKRSYKWFCNRLHKNAYYSRLQREKREAKREDISCNVCNIVFTPKRIGAVTCSKHNITNIA